MILAFLRSKKITQETNEEKLEEFKISHFDIEFKEFFPTLIFSQIEMLLRSNCTSHQKMLRQKLVLRQAVPEEIGLWKTYLSGALP